MFQHECSKHGLTNHKHISNGVGRGRRRQCIKCLRERQTLVHRRKKAKLVETAGGKCIICGYNKWLAALDFHHLDPTTKIERLSQLTRDRNIQTCLVEATKCVLICANCHREIETSCQDTIETLERLLAEQAGIEPTQGC